MGGHIFSSWVLLGWFQRKPRAKMILEVVKVSPDSNMWSKVQGLFLQIYHCTSKMLIHNMTNNVAIAVSDSHNTDLNMSVIFVRD